MQKIDRQVAFTGTKDVAEPLRFDPAGLEAYLSRAVKGFARNMQEYRQYKTGGLQFAVLTMGRYSAPC